MTLWRLLILGAWLSVSLGAQAVESLAWERLRGVIEHELADKQIPAISVAVVRDQNVIWAKGFGYADPVEHQRAGAGTVYRVGSVSKLFTGIAIMQLVERGQIDLDAPVSQYLPEFQPRNPFGKPILVRHLMNHRSGLVREPPKGSYFDPSPPSLAETVRSLNQTALIYAPDTYTKYSNAAVSVLGRLLEVKTGVPFAEYMQQQILDPIGMRRSSFVRSPAVRDAMAHGVMWTYDGRVFPAPVFDFGITPAGNLAASVEEMARFVSTILRGGAPLLRQETLERMWQASAPGAQFGLSFALGTLDGHRIVGHGGAVFGFATEVAMLPEAKLGVVVAASKDSANAVVRMIAQEALRAALALQTRQTTVWSSVPSSLSREEARQWEGRYENGADVREVEWRDGNLLMTELPSGRQLRLGQSGLSIVWDDVLRESPRKAGPAQNVLQEQSWRKVERRKPSVANPAWRELIGEYGLDNNILYVLEREGHLSVLIEWFDYYALEEPSPGHFRFPPGSLYDGEELTFERNREGTITAALVSGVRFARRPVGAANAPVFRIQPVRAVAELREEAKRLKPPVEAGQFRAPELVDLTTLDPAIHLDVRYATKDNFLSTPVYSSARAFLQRPAAEALRLAQDYLKNFGFGLLIHDAYRPWYITKVFWEATPPAQHEFVADPAKGSRHNRGCAVDLTLYDLKSGQPVEMTGLYDEMSPRSYPDYPGSTSLARWHRDLLRRAMEQNGFTVYTAEWWHFDYRDWPFYRIENLAFEELGREKRQ